MKEFVKYIVPVLLVALVGCETVDFGDTNENPNGAKDPSPSGLLAGGIMDFGAQSGYIQTLLVQYQAQVAYTDEMLYAQYPYSWAGYYLQINALNQVIDIVSDPAKVTPAVLLQGSVDNQKAAAMIFRALVFKRITDTWGDAPYSEADQGIEDTSPAYDTQEKIYKGVIADIQTARDLIDTEETAPTGDILYGGDLVRWKKLCNSLLIQTALQLSKRYPGSTDYAASVFKEAYGHQAGYIREVSEEAWFSFTDLSGLRNPWNGLRVADYYLSKEFTDALKGNINESSLSPTSNSILDERYNVYVMRTNLYPSPDGIPYGYRDGNADQSNAQMNRTYFWNPTARLPLMTASYTYLNIAEACALGWIQSNVNTMLRNGIVKSYESVEKHSKNSIYWPQGIPIVGSASSYAAARISDAEFVPGGVLQIIAEEKWISLFAQPFDAWNERRRTGYPDLKPATDYYNDGTIPTRFIYPREEVSLNGTNYQQAVARMGQDINSTHVWWDLDE